MANEATTPANTPADNGTGGLSIDAAVDALLTPLPPQRDTPRREPAETDPEPDDTEETSTVPESDPSDADTDDDEPEQTDDPEAEPSEEDTEPRTEPSYDVVVDGKKSAVPVSELVKGYQRQQAFTQRSQELADARRGFESERDAVAQERSQYSRLLVSLKRQIEGAGEQEPDWEYLQQADPANYPFHWARWQQRKEKLNAIEQEQGRLAEEEQRTVRQRMETHVQEQARLLLEKIPEYRDQAARHKDRDAIRDFATSTYGYSADEISNLIDHRAVMVLRDARAYRQLQAKKPVVEKRVVEAQQPLPAKRGTLTTTQSTRIKTASERLNRSGRLEDAVELELARSARPRHGNGSSSS